MSERLTLDLDLVDKVSGPALRAAKALQAAQFSGDKFANAWRGIGKAAASEASKAASEIAKQEAATRRLGLAQLQAAAMNKKFDEARAKASGGHGGFFSSFRSALPFRSIGDYFKGAFWGHLAAEGVEKIADGFTEGAKEAVKILYEGVREAFKSGAEYEQLKVSYGLLLGKQGGAAALHDIARFSGKTRYDDDEIAQQMRPLFNAGLSGQSARTAYATATDIQAARGGDIGTYIEQLSKIQLKGGVSDKLLIGLGIELKPFFADLAKTQRVSVEAAKKLAESGKTDPQVLLNAITAGVNRRQGGPAGTGGEAMSKTMGARLHKLSILPEEYLKQMSESPAWSRLSDKVGEILEGLSPDGERGQKIIASLFRVFDKLADWLASFATEDTFDRVAEGVGKVVDFLMEVPSLLNQAITAAEVFAAIWVGVKVVNGISAVVSGLTAVSAAAAATGPGIVATTAAVATLGTTLLAAAAAAGALVLAYKQISDTVAELGGSGAVWQDFKDFVSTAGMEMPATSKGNPGFEAMQAENAKNVALAHQRQNVVINMNGAVHVQAEKDDPTHTGQTAGEEIHKGMVRALEKAAQEGG